jgi:riboflavin synthase
MFTGLVDDIGVIEQVSATEAGREIRVRCTYSDLSHGESIAVDGACLTVREHGDGWFSAAAVVTTLERTAMASWVAGRRVNLERAMRLSDRLGGHIVQGHVDAVGSVKSVKQRDDAWLITIAVPPEVEALLVPHGSITIDGVSLTVNEVLTNGRLSVSIIEYTWSHTTLSDRHPGDEVHVESDVLCKVVQRLMVPYLAAASSAVPTGITPQVLGTAIGLSRSLGL